jgi:beta-glucosidase
MGNEVLEYGVDILLAPGANIHRNPLCGRNFEYYSEDPLLTGKIAAAMINGVESNGVGTSLKHFAVNNHEYNRLANNSVLSERALREIYLRNFEIAVKESQPWTIMTSYNFINGTHAAENTRLLTDILRGEWGYEGSVMTDWGGGYDDAQIVRAGNEMIQPGSDERYLKLLGAIKDGSLAMADVDRAIERILKLVVKTPKFKGYKFSEAPDLKAHALVCKKVADEGVVLLKNTKAALPISTDNEIALFGVTSYDFIPGGTGSGNVNRPYVVDLQQGLANAGFRLEKDVDAFYKEYMADEDIRRKRIDGNSKWFIDREKAIEVIPEDLIKKAAENADAAMITIGRVFGEGKDRDYFYSYLLTPREQELVERVSEEFHAKGKKVIMIINSGGFIEMASWQDKVDAVVMGWMPGQEGGNTVASVLCGEVNPSGHLPSTISTSYDLEPSADNFPQVFADKPFNYSYYRQIKSKKLPLNTVKNIDYTNYEEGIYVGYRYFNTFAPKAIAYPFGFGLSYTTFDFKKMEIVEAEGGWNVNVTVQNTGKVAGKDVVQVYVKAPKGELDKPERELKGFAKTPELAAGESCTVTIYVSKESLASYDESKAEWVIDSGKYTFVAAQDALDNSLKKTIKL